MATIQGGDASFVLVDEVVSWQISWQSEPQWQPEQYDNGDALGYQLYTLGWLDRVREAAQ